MNDAILERVRQRGPSQRWKARFARRDTVDGCAPEWNDFLHPQTVTLHVALRTEAQKLKGRAAKEHPVGEILGIYVQEVRTANGGSTGWAEYGERSYADNGEFLAEEWRMQLLEEIE